MDPLPSLPAPSPEPAARHAVPPPPLPPQVIVTERRSGNGCLWAAVVMLSLVILAFLALFFMAGASLSEMNVPSIDQMHPARKIPRLRETIVQEGTAHSPDKIVQIDLDGIISSGEMPVGLLGHEQSMVDSIKRQLNQAKSDAKVKGIVLRINSPGGEVTASDTIYAAVKEVAKSKPVIVYMDTVAASGGYYVACGASKIVASETTLTGSIGVIMEGMSYHGLFEKIGMGTNTFTSGKFKDTLSGARPMRDDEKAYIQGLVDKMYQRFVGIVSESRKVPVAELTSGVADGRVMTGGDALGAKLVDKVGYIEDAQALARSECKAPDAAIVRYSKEPVSVLDILSLEASSNKKVEVNLPGANALPQLLPGRLYYLPPAWLR
ncbi:MAG: signal peptide peptidase SppA [Verrucomicrobiaceae bacterium]|nr:signal peptide peptidase SppA [Verrucomicrobiaceae bacterium]